MSGLFLPTRLNSIRLNPTESDRTKTRNKFMDHLSKLENQSVYILREAYNKFENLGMLWSIGKDSTVLLWLARKAFLGHVPFPLVHVDTTYKIPSMIEYRDKLVNDWKLQLIVGKNEEVLRNGNTFPQRQGHARRMLRHAQERRAQDRP